MSLLLLLLVSSSREQKPLFKSSTDSAGTIFFESDISILDTIVVLECYLGELIDENLSVLRTVYIRLQCDR